MYLHIGSSKLVKTSDIVGIFDADTATVSKITKNYLKSCEKDGNLINVSSEVPKSFVIVGNKEKEKIYLSLLSPKTLCARTENERNI